ncbi:unnamed protein product [Linum trigynum]|uniref:Reverse transcriptase domain-containing protein n=1 Tax=Linum trigynum TaxID=586398 RepID=A0AAV2GJQ5_9ROSI
MRNLGWKDGFGVGSTGRAGGLMVLWKPEVKVEIKGYSSNHIDMKVTDEGKEWRLTGVYGWPEQGNKPRTWNLIRQLGDLTDLPWVMTGDFNLVQCYAEKNGRYDANEQEMEGFNKALEECNLVDLGFYGRRFTWDNNHKDDTFLEERLDRMVATNQWMTLYPQARVYHLNRCGSDHNPLLLQTQVGEAEVRWGTFFRFEAYWQKHQDIKEVVEEGWRRNGGGSILQKLRRCEEKLKHWSKATFGNLKHRKKEIERVLGRIGKLQMNQALIQQRDALEKELEMIFEMEELKWKQRSRTEWLREGDKNTKYFHRRASERRERNTIRKLRYMNGELFEGQDRVAACLVAYYKQLYLAGPQRQGSQIIEAIPRKVTEEMNEGLLKPFTREEIWAALKQMGPLKAPGVDGMPALFFQKNWEVIGDDVTRELQGYLEGGFFPEELNQTLITLIPKKKTPVSPADFRPISLCRVLYKILSKVLANRLKEILPEIIVANQSAFVPGRLITDNIIVAFECFHTMEQKKKGKSGWMAAKLDITKAYDRVDWSFLEAVMTKLGFNERWIHLIMECVTTVSFSLLVNGHKTEWFKPTRGLRQGDPISPYLFLLVAEGLSGLISVAEREKKITGIRVKRGAPSISHLLFADDSILFTRATKQESEQLKRILNLYELESGQQVNLVKSELSFSPNIEANTRNELAGILGMKGVEFHEKYLGLPTRVGRGKRAAFGYLVDRVRSKVKHWKSKLLSIAGKEVLIKAVAQSQMTYAMSIFSIPMATVKEIQSLITNFWWGQQQEEKKTHWLRWEELSRPKKQGGLGFRDLKCFNIALLGKQLWRIIKEPQSLAARVLKAKYFPTRDVLEAEKGRNPSLVWRGLIEAQELIKKGYRWRVGNGESIDIWLDRWIPSSEGYKVTSPGTRIGETTSVAELMEVETRTWRYDLLQTHFNMEDQKQIEKILIPQQPCKDEKIWTKETTGIYSVRSAYKLWKNRHEEEFGELYTPVNWKRFWKLKIPPKVRLFAWRWIRDILPTRARIVERTQRGHVGCPFCDLPESQYHIFRDCAWVRRVSRDTPMHRLFERGETLTCEEWYCNLQETETDEQLGKFLVALWFIWDQRNSQMWNKRKLEEREIIPRAIGWLEEYLDMQEVESEAHRQRDGKWRPAQSTEFTISVDAGCLTGQGTGLGAVIRKRDGDFVAAAVKRTRRQWEAMEAEAMAVKFGM